MTQCIWRTSITLSGCLFAAFVVFVIGFARMAGPWVDELDDQNGEIVAKRATSAAAAGRNEQSIELFEQALRIGFQAPDQYVWVRQKFVGVLLEAGRYERAEAIAAEVLTSGVPEISDWVGRDLFSKTHSALMDKGQYDQAAAAAGRWYDAGVRCGNPIAQGQGLLLKGISLLASGKTGEAEAAFAAAYEANPTPQMKTAIERESGKLNRQ